MLNLSHCELVDLPPDLFLHNSNLTVLDLSHNSLSHLDIELAQTQLKHLNLSHNFIHSLADTFRGEIELLPQLNLDLTGNPLICGCNDTDFLKWIKNSNISFVNPDAYLCQFRSGMSNIFHVDIASLGRDCSQWFLPVLASLSTLVVIAIPLIGYRVYRKRWSIRHFLFLQRERYDAWRNGENGSNASTISGYQYDAFVLYCSEDEDRKWVHFIMVREMEEIYGFKLCIHHRDFIGGMDIADNIEDAIRNSRKVIAILSPNFLRSNYGTTEISMTCSVDRNKLIMVMLRELPLTSGEYIPAMLRNLLETQTYIEWNDDDDNAKKLFWKRLYKAMHRKPHRD